MAAAVVSGCAAPGPGVRSTSEPLRVTGEAGPLAYHQGAEARRLADAQCGPRGVRSSINDRYEGGAWIFVEGCA
jgi:succinate dehydrogenase/fumarate reductase flavoprotein subunit